MINLIQCTTRDTRLVSELGRETYFDAFQAMNTPGTTSLYLEEAFDETKIRNELATPGSEFHLLYHEKQPAGYIKINRAPVQSDINDPASLELERIYVRKGWKGLGYGRILMEHAVSLARKHNCTYLWLGVWEKNKEALAFYARMGFVEFGTHKFRMGDELQSDLLLKKTI